MIPFTIFTDLGPSGVVAIKRSKFIPKSRVHLTNMLFILGKALGSFLSEEKVLK